MLGDAFIELMDVRKSYGKNAVLRGVNLKVMKADVLSLVGPSGSGKSTLLRCINRLVEIDSGKIIVDGRDIREYEPTELRKKAVLVPQISAMFPGTVKENILFPLKSQGIEDIKKAEKALRDSGVPEELWNNEAERLSGGEKKRVALARAIALEPDALLLDEPTAGVDPKRVKHIERTILNLVKDRGITVIWVTHDTDQALRVGDRIASIKGGKILKTGKKEDFRWEGVY